MQAGLLKERITIQRIADKPLSPYGGDVETWEDLRTIRARKVHKGGGVSVNALELYPSVTVIFETHMYQDIKRTDRVKHGDDLYRITDIEKNLKTKRLLITTERVND